MHQFKKQEVVVNISFIMGSGQMEDEKIHYYYFDKHEAFIMSA